MTPLIPYTIVPFITVIGAVSISLFGSVSTILKMEPQGQIEKVDDRSARQFLDRDGLWSDREVALTIFTNLPGWQLCVTRSQDRNHPDSREHTIYLQAAMAGKQVEVPIDVDQTVVLIGDGRHTSQQGTRVSVQPIGNSSDSGAGCVLFYQLKARDR